MQGIKAPDPERFTELVNQYQLPLLRMCCLHLKDADLAKDAVQETFIKAYRAWPTFRGGCSRQTWLMRIAINTCRDMQRSWWHRHVCQSITPDQLPEPSQGFPEDALVLNEAIARLPVRLREAVLLYYYQDLTMEETARVLGISLAAVSGRLKRARVKLRTALKGVYFDE